MASTMPSVTCCPRSTSSAPCSSSSTCRCRTTDTTPMPCACRRPFRSSRTAASGRASGLARELVAQRRNELDSARRAVAENVIRAWRQLDSARSRVTSYESQVRANEVALNGVRQEALVGSRTTLGRVERRAGIAERSGQPDPGAPGHAGRLTTACWPASAASTARTLALPVEYYDEERYYKRGRLPLDRLGQQPARSGTGNILPSANPAGVAGSAPPAGSTPASSTPR